MIGAILRRLLWRLARQRALLLVLALVVLAGGAYLVTRAMSPEGGMELGVALPGQGGEPPAVSAYLRGNRSFDADLIWNAYSDEAKERLRSRGGGLEELKRQLSLARERGTRIEDAVYVGGHQLPNGSSMHFYVVRISGAQTQGQREFVPYVFTLDGSGKISRVQ